MVDIRPQDLNPAVTPIDADSPIIIDQGLAGVNRTTSTEMVDAVAPVASQSEAEVGTDDVKRMTALKTKQSIASEVGVSVASYAAGQAGLSAVQSVNGKSGNAVTLVKADVGLGNVDNTSDVDKPISTATQTALNGKATSAQGNKADSAIQAPGGSAGQILAKNSASDNDVAWISSESATAVSYGPQTLTDTQQAQARQNIQADKSYDSIASVAAATVPVFANAIRTNGYYAAGDGGGALYKRVATEPTHAGKVQAAGGAWWEICETNLRPAMFGAYGNGVSDDTTYFQNTIDCAYDIGAKIDAFSSYLCGPLNVSVHINGGKLGKITRLSSSGPWLTMLENSSVTGMEIDGNLILNRCFEVDGANDVEISGNRVSRIRDHFVHFNGVKNLYIQDNIYVSGFNGISNIMPDDSTDAIHSDNVIIVNNHIEDLAGSAIQFAGKQSASDVNFGVSNPLVTNFVCIGNTIKNCNGNGIIAQSWHGVISNNTLQNVGNAGGRQGIVCQGRFLTVSGNALNGGLGVGIDMGCCFHSTVVGNQVIGHAQIGIELQSCYTVTCSGNTVVSCGFGITGQASAGIAILQGFFGSSWTSTNISVNGNTVASGPTPGSYGISVGSGCKNNIVSGNSIIASGSINPKYTAPDAEVMFYGNLENAGETKEFVLYSGSPVIAAKSPSGNADIGLRPQGSGRMRIYQSFPSAAVPDNFVAQVMIEIKDVSGSSYFVPAKYGSGW